MSTISNLKEISIPLSVPLIAGNEWKYVRNCLDTGWVSSVGNYVTQFEKMVAEYVGSKYAVATVNGTSALHMGLIVSGVSRNDEVIVPTLTFIAPVNAVRYCGATPVFMDCEPNTLCLDTEKLGEFLRSCTFQKNDGYTYNNRTKKRIKAIIPVHVFGHPTNMLALMKLCDKYNLTIIEDSTESLGSTFKKKQTGTFGALGCFSFNGNKIITTGGGGMVVTDDEAIALNIKHLSTQAKSDPFEYDHDEVGYNYRLTNIQAAMGIGQMEKLAEFIFIKRHNSKVYRGLLSQLEDVHYFWEEERAESNCWFYTIQVSNKNKDPLIKFLLKKNIQVRPVWKLIHTLPMYKYFEAYEIESALKVYETCINLPCSVSLTEEELQFVVRSIKKYYE